MFRLAAFFGLIGLAAVTAIIASSGAHAVLQALDAAGWGILWASLSHLVSMIFCIIGWRALIPGRQRPSYPFFLYTLWLRAAVNNMMPVARIGGEMVAVRTMMKHGVSKLFAVASTTVELTTSVVAAFLFDLLGIVLFMLRVGDRDLGWRLAAGLLISAAVIGLLAVIQRFGIFGLLDKIFVYMLRDAWRKFAGDMHELDRAVHATYRRPARVFLCTFWQFAAWCAGAGELWLALFFLGHPLSVLECVMLEALIQAAAGAAFVVPGALGVQEAGFLVFGRMLGLTPEIAVALAMMRRCRDLLLYVPGLIAWQVEEGHRLLKRK